MKKLLILLLALLSVASQAQFRSAQASKKYGRNVLAANKCNVYMFIGDSNMKGEVDVPVPVPANYQGPHANTLIYAKNNLTTTDNGAFASTQQGVNEMPGYATPYAKYGSTMALSYELGRLVKKKVAIIKLGVGGSTLVYRSGTDLCWHSSTGTLWQKYRDYFVNVALPKLASAGYNYTIKGAVIRLGTNDVFFYDLTSFKAQIQTLVTNIRTLAGNSSLPIYWYLVRTDLQDRPDPYSDPAAGTVAATRQALLDCANSANGAFIDNFYTIESDGSSGDLIFDGTHFTATVYNSQGLNEASLLYAIGE